MVWAGVYASLSISYFAGYLGNNYPQSQKRLADQNREINDFKNKNIELLNLMNDTKLKLEDATTELAKPGSTEAPSYDLPTYIRLQYDDRGQSRELSSSNVNHTEGNILEAEESEIPANPTPAPDAFPEKRMCGIFENSLLNDCNNSTGPTIFSPGGFCKSYKTSFSRLLILNFIHPIKIEEIKMDPFGSKLPQYEIITRDKSNVVIKFNEIPTNVAIDIKIEQRKN